jgi:hypothetical protein
MTARFPLMMAAALIAAGCIGPAEQSPPSAHGTHAASPVETWLAIGDEIRVDSLLRVRLRDVVSDSRCPPAPVVCVWEGDAGIEILYGPLAGTSYADTLHLTRSRNATPFAGYRITFLELAPGPSVETIPRDAYTARLRIERVAP